jgi:micrococcal nuclease
MIGPTRMAAGAWAALAILSAAFVAICASNAPAKPAPNSPRFSICASPTRFTCVVDGDTFWLNGEKIRIADIDTPEVGQPKCRSEYEAGKLATGRLRDLLNKGPFELVPIAGRDRDRHGRLLRVVVRKGRSLGDQLVAEGHARTWSGRREPWC